MTHILTPYNSRAILNNLELVFKTNDITKLNKPTYNFVMLMSGFIAHYDLRGFQSYYQDVSQFIGDILSSVESYTPDIGYETESYGADYANSKHAVYEVLPSLCNKYKATAQVTTTTKATEALQKLTDICNEALRRNDPDLILGLCKELNLNI